MYLERTKEEEKKKEKRKKEKQRIFPRHTYIYIDGH
jgi:hypothetical protein